MAKKKNPSGKSSIDKDLSELRKYIQEQNFGSIEQLQEFLNQAIGKRVGEIIPQKKQKKNKKEQAQDLVYDAYESNLSEGKKLIEEALKLDPENVDALVYLAECQSDPNKALEFYQKAVDAGTKSIGERGFEEMKGHFWGFHETRPYMKAKAGLAEMLYFLGKKEEGTKHLQEMLVLNSDDNQGIRYRLVILLIDQDRDEEYLKLFEKYEGDISAIWLFTYALYLFRKEGNSPNANQALEKAIKQNRFVAPYLKGRKKLPRELPDYIGLGDENEGVYCASESLDIWVKTKGAVDWINKF